MPPITAASVVLPTGTGHLDRYEARSGRLTHVLAARGRAVPGDQPGNEGPVAVTVLEGVALT